MRPWFLLLAGCLPAADPIELTFPPRDDPRADLLLVIDDGPAMAGLQAELGWAFPTLRAALAGVDWRLVVTTTDLDDPATRGHARQIGGAAVVGAASEPALFEALVAPPDTGGADRGLGAAEQALGPLGAVTELRPDTELHVIVVSLGDDCTDDGALADPADCASHPEQLVPDWALAERLSTRSGLRLHAIGDPDGGCGRGPATRYASAASRLDGLPLAWCDPLDASLLAIGEDASGRRSAFSLPRAPDAETLVVTVGGVPIPARADEGYTLRPAPPLLLLHGEARPQPDQTVEIAFRPATGD